MKKLLTRYSYVIKNLLKKKWGSSDIKRHKIYTLKNILVALFVFFIFFYIADQRLIANYRKLESVRIEDRNGVVLTLLPNSKGAYAHYASSTPDHVKKLLIKKEDRFFYFHLGFNPFSIVRAMFQYGSGARVGGASTITEQLVKNLLGHEQDRSITNKLAEIFYSISLEVFTSKDEILNMYANTAYMGNQVQGLSGASVLYFNRKLEDLDDTKLIMLLSTLSSPTNQNPWETVNGTVARNLANRISITFDPSMALITQKHAYSPPQNLELFSMKETCAVTCQTTLDGDLTNQLRSILNQHVEAGWDAGARSGAIVVIKLPENELLSIIGTPNTKSFESGQQINMAIENRPIGSTAKPFIYLQGFTKGLRPYTLVNDREYKFPVGSGFSLYPKNYDGSYQGWVTLHAALSNSMNVPTVKVLQYVGLNDFYNFMEQKLNFTPLRDFDTYKYGIALGALEIDPLTLAHLLSIFPEQGVLKPLRLFLDGKAPQAIDTPMSRQSEEKIVAEPALTQLVTKILNDRLTGVQQFGLASSLNLPESNYAVKTGTSEDYHDSWTVGYTPDFLIVVWFGNPDNTPLKHITGQSGAGSVWHDAMQLLMNSKYNRKTPFDFSLVKNMEINGSIDFGIQGDVLVEHRNLLPDDSLIMSPIEGDTFLKESGTSIPLVSQKTVSWFANGELLGVGKKIFFSPPTANDYTIKAVDETKSSAQIIIHVMGGR